MSTGPERGGAGGEPSLEELLDNTPEAVSTRRARAARAQAAARAAERAEAERARPSSLRRRLVLGGVLGLGTLARVLSRAGGRRSQRP